MAGTRLYNYPHTIRGLESAKAAADDAAQRHDWTFHVIDRRGPSSHRARFFVTPNGCWDYRGACVYTADPKV